jgi:MFS family permease
VYDGASDGEVDSDWALLSDCIDVYDKITKIGGSVVVSEDECVAGDVVVMGGNAVIRGKVGGSVTATGRVRISSTAVVRGNVAAEEVISDPGSDVRGSITETQFPWPPEAPVTLEDRSSGTLVMFMILAIQLVAVMIVSIVFPRASDRLREVYQEDIFKSLAIGFLAEILFLPAFILLLITIIGIPIAIVGLPLAVVGAGLLGLAAFSLFVNDLVKTRNGDKEEGRAMRTLTGFVILQSPVIGLFFFQMVNVDLAAVLFGIVSGILVFIVFTSSLGAAILTRFGTRDYQGGRREVTVRVETIRSSKED